LAVLDPPLTLLPLLEQLAAFYLLGKGMIDEGRRSVEHGLSFPWFQLE
jgi:hypothetical protein